MAKDLFQNTEISESDNVPKDLLAGRDLFAEQKNESGILKSLGIGAVKGVSDLYTGGAQLLNKAGIISDEYLKKLESERQSDISKYKSELESTSGKIGQFVGETIPTMAIPGGVTGGFIRRAVTSGLGGAAIGALQPTEENQSHLTNAFVGAGMGVGGQAVMSGVGAGVNALRGGTRGAQAIERQALSEKLGVPLTFSEEKTGQSSRIDTALERMPWIFGNKEFRKVQLEKAEQASKGFFSKYIIDPTLDTTQAMKENNDRFLNTMYEAMKREGRQMPQVQATEVKAATTELLDRFPGIFESIQDNNVKKVLKNVYGDVADKPILDVNGNIIGLKYPKFSFDDLWMLRKGLGQEIRDAKTETAQGQFKRLYGAVTDDMDTMFSKGGGPAGQMFKDANDAWKQYSLKFDVLRQAYDKSMGTIKAGEFFSPKKFSTELKNLANDPNYKKSIKWTSNEIEEMTGLANILQYARRSGQFKENPPTGNRWGLEMTGAGIGGTAYAVGGIAGTAKTAGSTLGLSYLTKLLTTTKVGKDLSFAASKIEAGSPQMQKIIDKLYAAAPKMAAVEGTEQ
jgi:hypothetical protein